MSGSDDKETQCEERTTESSNEIMGDVLAKEAEDSVDVDAEIKIKDESQALDRVGAQVGDKVSDENQDRVEAETETQVEIQLDSQPNQDNDNYPGVTTDSEEESRFRNISPCEADAAPEIPVVQLIPESTSTVCLFSILYFFFIYLLFLNF